MRAFRVAYDGTDYYGFQRQPDVVTVEDTIFDALRALGVLSERERKPDGYAAAGRTDAGVSALAQTIAFETPDWLTPRALNGELPGDVRVWAVADAPKEFHATHDAVRREYVYYLYAPRRLEGEPASERPVDDERFRAALEVLSGEHNFTNLTPDERNTRRTLSLEAAREGPFLVVTVAASGFARELVRRLVSLARAVGTGAASLEKIDRVLDPGPLPGHEGVPPAPPEPLVLADVTYPGLKFQVDDAAAESARSVFDHRRIERRTAARVAEHLSDGIGEREGSN